MKIWYADQWLVTGNDVDDIAAESLSFSGQQAVQVAAYVRGAAVEPFARGNREQAFTLVTTRQCESVEEARRLAAAALQLVQTSGELRIEQEDESTIATDKAVVQTCEAQRVGVHLALTWKFVLGTWTVTPTPEIIAMSTEDGFLMVTKASE